MLKGSSNEEKVFNYLIGQGLTPAGACGVMGNIYAESGFIPNNLQNTGNTKLAMSDEQYTTAVDNGIYTNFVHDGFGYGICQWTFWSLKEGLLNYVRSKGSSIGDLESQLEYFISYLKSSMPNTLNILKTTTDVKTASNEILMKFERPASVSNPSSQECLNTQNKRYEYGMNFYEKYVSTKGDHNMNYTNSSLATYRLISPNKNSPRNHEIDRISIHCVVGQLTAKRTCELFQDPNRQASCNYAVGLNGDIALCVEERDRSWCTSSAANDNRAITMEVASDMSEPYAVTPKAYAAVLDLCTDICKRYGKKKLIWIPDKTKALAYTPAPDEMQLTVHRWFANKSCLPMTTQLLVKTSAEGQDTASWKTLAEIFKDHESEETAPSPAVTVMGFDPITGAMEWQVIRAHVAKYTAKTLTYNGIQATEDHRIVYEDKLGYIHECSMKEFASVTEGTILEFGFYDKPENLTLPSDMSTLGAAKKTRAISGGTTATETASVEVSCATVDCSYILIKQGSSMSVVGNCPGTYLFNKHTEIANEVTRRLGGSSSSSAPSVPSTPSQSGQIYRVRKSWGDVKSQVGAYRNLESAKKLCDQNPGFSVFDEQGNIVYPEQAFKSYKVRISVPDLNIRKGPGTGYATTGQFTGKGVFTIVDEKAGPGSTKGWGNLKAGGWISLDYAQKI